MGISVGARNFRTLGPCFVTARYTSTHSGRLSKKPKKLNLYPVSILKRHVTRIVLALFQSCKRCRMSKAVNKKAVKQCCVNNRLRLSRTGGAISF